MIISYIYGGLANPMFRYATGLRLAREHATVLKLDLRDFASGNDERPRVWSNFAARSSFSSFPSILRRQDEIHSLRDHYYTATTGVRLVRQIRKFPPGFLFPAWHIRQNGFRFDTMVLELPDNVCLDGFWQRWKYFSDCEEPIRNAFESRDKGIVS